MERSYLHTHLRLSYPKKVNMIYNYSHFNVYYELLILSALTNTIKKKMGIRV